MLLRCSPVLSRSLYGVYSLTIWSIKVYAIPTVYALLFVLTCVFDPYFLQKSTNIAIIEVGVIVKAY